MTKGLTPTKAAIQWGLHRSVLYEKMKKGELSYTTDKKNNGKERRVIDPSEMIRVFGEPEIPTSNSEKKIEIRTNAGEIEVYQDFIESLKAQLTEKDSLIRKQADLLATKDHQVQTLIDQLADTTQRLLPAPLDPENDYLEDNDPEPPQRRWWQFRRKTGVV